MAKLNPRIEIYRKLEMILLCRYSRRGIAGAETLGHDSEGRWNLREEAHLAKCTDLAPKSKLPYSLIVFIYLNHLSQFAV